MGTYHLLLWLWAHGGPRTGDGEAFLRIPSAVFAVATLPFIYFISARLFNRRVGLIAALLTTLNTFFIHYAQEARG